MEQTKFNLEKFGFVITENQEHCNTYEKRVADMIICLIDCAGMVTLYFWQNDNKIQVANRYIVETQEQLDFLILNGRVGWCFREKGYMDCPPKK